MARDQAMENSHGDWIYMGDPIHPQELQSGSHSGQSLASQDPSQPIKTLCQSGGCMYQGRHRREPRDQSDFQCQLDACHRPFLPDNRGKRRLLCAVPVGTTAALGLPQADR